MVDEPHSIITYISKTKAREPCVSAVWETSAETNEEDWAGPNLRGKRGFLEFFNILVK